MRVLGADVSLNHSGFVLIDDECSVIDYAFITERAGDANKNRRHSTRWKAPKTKDKGLKQIARLSHMDQLFRNILERMRPQFVVIEDYAFDTHGAHQMGEVVGCFRLSVWRRGCPQRWQDPLTVKMYAAHKGNAKKGEVQEAVKRRWQVDFERCGLQGNEDLCDAYVLAHMGVTELKLRNGTVLMNELHPKEIQVFNRTTRAAPINILGRSLIELGAL